MLKKVPKSITVKVPPGIGDIAWIFQKIQGHFDCIDVIISHDETRRAQGFVKALAGVRTVQYAGERYSKFFNNVPFVTVPHNTQLKSGMEVFLAANHWMHEGNRLEDWLPQYPIKYSLDYRPLEHGDLYEKYVLPNQAHRIAFAPGNAGKNERGSGLSIDEWNRFARKLEEHYPKSTFFMLGGSMDYDYMKRVLVGTHMIPTFDFPIQKTMELIKNMNGCFSFPTGLPILSGLFGVATFMFMPPKLHKMHYAWVDPEQVNKTFVNLQFKDKDRALSEFIRICPPNSS